MDDETSGYVAESVLTNLGVTSAGEQAELVNVLNDILDTNVGDDDLAAELASEDKKPVGKSTTSHSSAAKTGKTQSVKKLSSKSVTKPTAAKTKTASVAPSGQKADAHKVASAKTATSNSKKKPSSSPVPKNKADASKTHVKKEVLSAKAEEKTKSAQLKAVDTKASLKVTEQKKSGDKTKTEQPAAKQKVTEKAPAPLASKELANNSSMKATVGKESDAGKGKEKPKTEQQKEAATSKTKVAVKPATPSKDKKPTKPQPKPSPQLERKHQETKPMKKAAAKPSAPQQKAPASEKRKEAKATKEVVSKKDHKTGIQGNESEKVAAKLAGGAGTTASAEKVRVKTEKMAEGASTGSAGEGAGGHSNEYDTRSEASTSLDSSDDSSSSDSDVVPPFSSSRSAQKASGYRHGDRRDRDGEGMAGTRESGRHDRKRKKRDISPIVFDRKSSSDSESDEVDISEEEEIDPSKNKRARLDLLKEQGSKLKYIFRDSAYFLIKSNNHENISLAKAKGVWSTPPQNEAKLNKAFKECRNVILVYSVKESGKFQGYARLSSESRHDIAPPQWVLPPGMTSRALGGVFKIDWVNRKELAFSKTLHLHNSWNENKPVKIGRDGQEIEHNCGESLCRLFPFDENIDLTSVARKAKHSRNRVHAAPRDRPRDHRRHNREPPRLHRGGGREYDRGPPRRGGYGAQQREGRPPPGMFKDPRRDRGGMPRFGVRRETMLNGMAPPMARGRGFPRKPETYNDYMKELSYRGPSSIESRSYGHMFERSVDDFLRRTKASRGMSRSSDRRYRDRR
ncbi:PREDICTED: YTH domain-containing protein 1-like [Priapulus caudatus]|uniref:YTH domain-containing protein 1-like n=1 Tax=Priapulus caudatus TaxID=37621 RepID=A0ABM1E4L4_PRICU|nr:PREDICTED: YTH domain-containing protein 1-like [Priapulus caudatus]